MYSLVSTILKVMAQLQIYSRLSRSFTARGSVSGEPTKGIRHILSKFIKYDLFVTVSILTDGNGGEKM